MDEKMADRPGVEFYSAASVGDVQFIQSYIKNNPSSDFDACKGFGKNSITPLILASQNGHQVAAGVLLDAGCDVNKPGGGWGWTPLLHASNRGHIEMVELLVKHGADVNQTDKSQVTPLIVASEKGHADIVKFLLQYGADFTMKTGFEPIPSYLRAEINQSTSISDMEYLKEQYIGNTALLKACWMGHLDVVKEISLKEGVHLEITTSGHTALYIACRTADIKLVQYLLLKERIDLNCKNRAGLSPLMVAIRHLFLGGEYSTRQRRNRGGDCQLSRVSRLRDIIKLLVQEGADVHTRDSNSLSLLYTLLTSTFPTFNNRFRSIAPNIPADNENFETDNSNLPIESLTELSQNSLTENKESFKGFLSEQLEAIRFEIIDCILSASARFSIQDLPAKYNFSHQLLNAYPGVVGDLHSLLRAPQTLLHLSRCHIRALTGPHALARLHSEHGLPMSLQKYLMFK